ncbi:RNA pyrophosphohydrolase [Sandaracinobacteroides sp. A072]|uniref:RNA pyrophosphohydrolase n=1 Tax=Sandaracinobacteroides sp. A072 TaxID=3461146 RepID=UPI00404188DF
MKTDPSKLPYRPGVGVMLVNPMGHVFVGQRYDSIAEAWQMPQGGIDKGEEPLPAALRELEEETGVLPNLVQPIAETRDWLTYDLPPELLGRIWGGKYRGQRQKWYALRFLGTDRDVNLDAHAHHGHAEFKAWKWAPLPELPALIVPFKRDLYAAILKELGPHIR